MVQDEDDFHSGRRVSSHALLSPRVKSGEGSDTKFSERELSPMKDK